MSPLLFYIGEDILAKLIDYQGGVRKVNRTEAKLGVLVPFILLHADDIIIFCKANRNNVMLLYDNF